MSDGKIESLVRDMAQPAAARAGVELVDVEYVKEGAEWYLRVYIHKRGGVTIDDCEAVSRDLGAALDSEDPISRGYILEVSSPGLDRPLVAESDFQRHEGEAVDVTLAAPVGGKKKLQGTLAWAKGGRLAIKGKDGKETLLDIKDIAKATRAIFFP